jgi:hypothetical protein
MSPRPMRAPPSSPPTTRPGNLGVNLAGATITVVGIVSLGPAATYPPAIDRD